METIMIFGASGFLGSAIANSFSKNSTVIAVVRPESDTWRLDTTPKLLIKEPVENWAKLIQIHKPETVICAQWAGTEIHSRENTLLQESNIVQIEKLAEVSGEAKVSTFIVFGSQAETSKTAKLVPEEAVQNPASAYGATKIKLHRKLHEIFQGSDTRFIWARVFSIFGPSEIGETLIPNLLRAGSTGEPLQLKNPSLPWSYLYVEDFIAAIRKLIETKAISGVVNIGNNELVTIESICKLVPKGLYISTNQSTMIQEGYFPVIAKLQNAGWRPEHSLEESLRISVDGVISNLALRNLI
jgi:nucleoside-diphosphate-sugar epimerase